MNHNQVHANRAADLLKMEGARVLVVGCNTGKDLRYFVEAGAREVHGLDVIERTGADYSAPNVQYHIESAEEMSLPSEHFDLVYCFATMEHIPNIERAFQEFERVTRPGGFIYCIAAPLWNSRYGHHKGDVFADYPWIHLLKSKDDIIQFFRSQDEEAFVRDKIEGHVNYMMNPAHMNQVPAGTYVEVCRKIPNMVVLRNDLAMEPLDDVPDDLYTKLSERGYTKEELCAVTHSYIAKKRRGLIDDISGPLGSAAIWIRDKRRGAMRRLSSALGR